MATQLNIDNKELEKFAAFATEWWDPNGKLKTLHQVNPLRTSFIKDKIDDLSSKSLIDIGCGGGLLTDFFAKELKHVCGIDMSESLIQTAQLHQLESGNNVEYLVTTAENIAQERPAQYDIVTCFEMLEHVPDPYSIIKACANLAKPNGHLFFSTLNRNLKSYLFAILGAEYVLNLLPVHTHDYQKFIKPAELCQWLREAQINAQTMQGISYHPLTKTFSLTEDISVNYLVYAVKEQSI